MVILRFAPSPTGFLHVGNVRTALINYLFAQKNRGRFLLRFDDTDTERSEEAFKEAAIRDLDWLRWCFEDPFSQSERLHLYDDAVEKLKQQGRLYPCYETPQELDFKRKRLLASGAPPVYDRAALSLTPEKKAAYEAEGRKPHWRFHLDDKTVTWKDMTRGPLSYKSNALSDPILVRENGTYVYTLCSVVDDLDKGVTHIIRGNDHISNTAVQIQLTEALGGSATTFLFAHLPLLMDSQGKSLSKRLGSLSIQDLRYKKGIEPMAINTYLAQLGSSHDMVSFKNLNGLVKKFSLGSYSANSPKFSLEDLERQNAKLLRSLTYDEARLMLNEGGFGHINSDFWEAIHDNLFNLSDIKGLWSLAKGEVTPVIREEDLDYIALSLEHLPKRVWTGKTWTQWTDTLKRLSGRKGKALFMPLRLALTGKEHGPEMKRFFPLMCRETVRQRLQGKTA